METECDALILARIPMSLKLIQNGYKKCMKISSQASNMYNNTYLTPDNSSFCSQTPHTKQTPDNCMTPNNNNKQQRKALQQQQQHNQ
jgi:hypothetical protein